MSDRCLVTDCYDDAHGQWYCRRHHLQKEAVYGWYDLRTNNRGFRWWGVKRLLAYWKYLITR